MNLFDELSAPWHAAWKLLGQILLGLLVAVLCLMLGALGWFAVTTDGWKWVLGGAAAVMTPIYLLAGLASVIGVILGCRR